MNGIRFLLDTNVILGLLKNQPMVIEVLEKLELDVEACAYSSVTRMELLGFPGITTQESQLINSRLEMLERLPIVTAIEDETIAVRKQSRLKLPDAIICATALIHNVQLVTFDEQLRSVYRHLAAQAD